MTATLARWARLFTPALCALLAGCMVPALRSDPAADTVYVVRRGWHIDIGLPTQTLGPRLRPVVAAFGQPVTLLFGFGDRRYVLSRHRGLDGLRALWPGPALMLVTGLSVEPQTHDQVVVLHLPHVQALQLQNYVADSFAQMTPLQAGPYQGSLYFIAIPRYSALLTCNTWAAHALQAGGVPVHSAGVVLAGQLWSQLPGH